MKKQTNEPEKINVHVAHGAIRITVLATLALATIISINQKNPTVIAFQEKVGISKRKETVEIASKKLLESFYNTEEHSRRFVIENFISQRSPATIAGVAANLFAKQDIEKAGPLAVLISTNAAARYNDKRLYLIASIEYIKGNSTRKDFEKAKEILTLPILEENGLAEYFLGLWWLDKSNPQRNLSKAIVHLEKASSKGIAAAAAILKKVKPLTR